MSAATDAQLRAEHDALAARLHARRSVDEVRKAAYAGFFGLIALAGSGKLAFDRWVSERATAFKGPPIFFFSALALAAVLLALAGVWASRARQHAREEDALCARFLELRATLRLDP